ncbi:MAG: hypothetical protein N2B06_18685 [Clostridium sp.]
MVIIGGLEIALNVSKSQAKTPVNIAKEFGKVLYTVDAKKITQSLDKEIDFGGDMNGYDKNNNYYL